MTTHATAPGPVSPHRWLQRFAQVQSMLGVPALLVLVILYIGMENTHSALIKAQDALHRSNAALQHAAQEISRIHGAVEAGAALADTARLHTASTALASVEAALRASPWLVADATPARNGQVNAGSIVSVLSSARERLASVPVTDTAVLAQVALNLDEAVAGLADLQLAHERAVLADTSRLSHQQQRYAWGIRVMLVALLLLYIALAWLNVMQRRGIERLNQRLDALEKTNRARGDLFALLSHDVRTPMSGVVGFADLLEQTPLDATQREYVRMVRDSGVQLVRAIDDALELAWLDTEHHAAPDAPFNLRDTVSQVQALLADRFDDSVRLEVAVGDEVPARLMGDGIGLAKLLTHLLKSAAKSIDEGEVMLDIDATDRNELVIRVRDTGALGGDGADTTEGTTGINNESANRLSRASVAVTRQLIDRLAGDMDIRHVPGAGTEVVVHLPLRRVAETHETVTDAVAVSRKSLQVLVVEDNPVNQMVTRRMLESLGHRVDVAVDGEEGVERARANPYDLILMDLQMPRMSGIRAAGEIRRTRPSTKIVALSANALPEHRVAAEAAGMNGFLIKPARMNDFSTLIEALFPNGNSGQ